MNAIDTNVFACTFDPTVPEKQARSRQLVHDLTLRPHETVMLWQVAVELLAYLRKAQKQGVLTSEEVKDRFRTTLQLFELRLPTVTMFERGFVLHERFSLSHWVILLVAACQEAGVTCLYSEDMQHGADYHGVRVVNPFA